MKNLAEIETILKDQKQYLSERYKVREPGLFGSYRHGQQKASSDIDILVEFDEPNGLFDFVRLENELTRLLGKKVDLVMKDSLKPRLKDRVIKEAQFV